MRQSWLVVPCEEAIYSCWDCRTGELSLFTCSYILLHEREFFAYRNYLYHTGESAQMEEYLRRNKGRHPLAYIAQPPPPDEIPTLVHCLLRPHLYSISIIRTSPFSATEMHRIATPGFNTPKNTNFPRDYTAATRLITQAFPRPFPRHMKFEAQPVPRRYESHSVLQIPIVHLR